MTFEDCYIVPGADDALQFRRHVAQLAPKTYNSAFERGRVALIEEALREHYDAAQEIGCMDHGGFEYLSQAIAHALGIPTDPPFESLLGPLAAWRCSHPQIEDQHH